MKQTKLITWLFTRPILFSITCLLSVALASLILAGIQTYLVFDNAFLFYSVFALALIFPIYYTIKKLPHNDMSQSDFVAISNALSIICALIFVILAILNEYFIPIRRLYITLPILYIAFIIALSLYILGLGISGIYAKYKRCVSLGISKWKVILSIPFGFLMLWTPGYLLKGKDIKSNLEIKSAWYTKFTKWVLNKPLHTNITFITFLLLNYVFLDKAYALAASGLVISLLIIFSLWYFKHKSDFTRNINRGYALTAVCINIAVLVPVIYQLIIK